MLSHFSLILGPSEEPISKIIAFHHWRFAVDCEHALQSLKRGRISASCYGLRCSSSFPALRNTGVGILVMMKGWRKISPPLPQKKNRMN
jgi:hypothetical protein